MKIRERILTEETIVELVTLVAEEIDATAGELAGRLEVIDAELGDVRGPVALHLLAEAPRGAVGGCAGGRRHSA